MKVGLIFIFIIGFLASPFLSYAGQKTAVCTPRALALIKTMPKNLNDFSRLSAWTQEAWWATSVRELNGCYGKNYEQNKIGVESRQEEQKNHTFEEDQNRNIRFIKIFDWDDYGQYEVRVLILIRTENSTKIQKLTVIGDNGRVGDPVSYFTTSDSQNPIIVEVTSFYSGWGPEGETNYKTYQVDMEKGTVAPIPLFMLNGKNRDTLKTVNYVLDCVTRSSSSIIKNGQLVPSFTVLNMADPYSRCADKCPVYRQRYRWNGNVFAYDGIEKKFLCPNLGR